MLIALGLAICFRSNVWNIGAEGQFIVGALAATAVAMRAARGDARGHHPARHRAGRDRRGRGSGRRVVAFLRDRFNANEILVSLMLVYVADMLLGYLVYGPWKDPDGYNFPQTITFLPRHAGPAARRGAPRAHRAVRGAVRGAARLAVSVSHLRRASSWRSAVRRRAPRATPASRRAARSGRRCSVRAALAGLAGALEVTGPLGQLTPHLPVGYGFAAIIVAFVGRLHPVGILFSSILMSMFYIGGELAQSRLGLPKALTGVFQGLLLFTLLACDTLASYRVLRVTPRPQAPEDGRADGRRNGGAGLVDGLALMLAASLNAGTVLALAGLGLLVNERAGVLNLGAEGMMLVAALAGFATALHPQADGCSWPTWPPRARARAMAALFGVLVIGINTNQYATGLALSLFGVGFSAFAGASFVDKQLPERGRDGSPGCAICRSSGRRCFG